MLRLFELVLAVLGCWDIARRLLPVRVPVVIAELACIGAGLALLKWADPITITALCVPGGMMVLAVVVKPVSHIPWGSQVVEAFRIYRQRRGQTMRESRLTTRVGQRMPKL